MDDTQKLELRGIHFTTIVEATLEYDSHWFIAQGYTEADAEKKLREEVDRYLQRKMVGA